MHSYFFQLDEETLQPWRRKRKGWWPGRCTLRNADCGVRNFEKVYMAEFHLWNFLRNKVYFAEFKLRNDSILFERNEA